MADAKTIIAEAQTYAKGAYDQALPLVQNATRAIEQLRFVGFTGGVPALPAPEQNPLDVTFPEFQAAIFVPETPPPGPTDFQPDPDMDVGQLPTNTAVNPGFVSPALPAQLRGFTTQPPAINTDFVFPVAPSQLQNPNLTAPVVVSHTLPEKPDITLPVFDAVRPGELPAPPTDYTAQFEAAYRNIGPTMRAALSAEVDGFLTKHNPRFAEQMARLETRLAAYIEGGTALSPAVEDAIYSRTTRKVDAEYRRTLDASLNAAAKRGFSMPDGALFSAMRQSRQGAADNSTLAATEIAVKQAELEQANIQFAITTSSGLRTAMLNASLSYHGNLVQINGQALDYAKSVLSAMIEVYNALVKAYTAQLEGYKAEASVYETRMRGALALVEIFKAEIAAFTALTEAEMSKVRVYQAQIEALNSLASMYRTQVEAVVSRASLEKLKIELFGAQVEAYRAESGAKSSEYQGFAAAVSGQEGKLRAYSEEVRAYGTEVEAFRTKVIAKSTAVQSAIAFNDGITKRYLGAVEAYRAVTAGKAIVVTAQVESQRSQLLAVQAKFSAQEATARYGLEYYKARSTVNVESYKADVMAMIEGAKIATGQLKSIADISLGGADVYKGLASAALSGINTLVSQTLTE